MHAAHAILFKAFRNSLLIKGENPQPHQLNSQSGPKLQTYSKKTTSQTCQCWDNSHAVVFLPLFSLFEYSGSVLKRSCQPVSKQTHLSAVKSATRTRSPGRTARSLSPPLSCSGRDSEPDRQCLTACPHPSVTSIAQRQTSGPAEHRGVGSSDTILWDVAARCTCPFMWQQSVSWL